jgi:hypothetical protein
MVINNNHITTGAAEVIADEERKNST